MSDTAVALGAQPVYMPNALHTSASLCVSPDSARIHKVAAARETCDSSVQGSFAAAHWPEGFAVTGGAGGDTVVATTGRDFVDFVGSDEPLVVMVQGYLFVPARRRLQRDDDDEAALLPAVGGHEIASHKTILGVGDDAMISNGWVKVTRATNVIIQNVRFSGAVFSEGDAITLRAATYVWIDHCSFDAAKDGLVDVVDGSRMVTISWSRFSHHNKGILIGNSDSKGDVDKDLSVTLHHNWYQHRQRAPRVRFGRVHSYNNLHDNQKAAVSSFMGASVVVENSVFLSCDEPMKAFASCDAPDAQAPSQPPDQPTQQPTLSCDSRHGNLNHRGNIFTETRDAPEERGQAFEPSELYAYELDDASAVEALVRANAGSGRGWADSWQGGGR